MQTNSNDYKVAPIVSIFGCKSLAMISVACDLNIVAILQKAPVIVGIVA